MPKAKRPPVITFVVSKDPSDSRWNITRNGVATGGFARDMSTAIGMAYREASLEQAGTDAEVSVWSVQGGKRTKEWPTG